MSGEVALQSRFVVPVGARRVAWAPLVPFRIGGGNVDGLLAAPGATQGQVRVEPHVGFGKLFDLVTAAAEQRLDLAIGILGLRPLDLDFWPDIYRRLRCGG